MTVFLSLHYFAANNILMVHGAYPGVLNIP